MRISTQKLALMAVLIAIGVATAGTIWFPAGVARAYPMQHAINVLAAVLLGPGPAVVVAFVIGVLRNLLGLGTLLAFPGGMIGAYLAGVGYRLARQRMYGAVGGEIFGTAVLGGLLSVPVARWLMGQEAAALFFIPPFAVSSIIGAAIGLVVLFALNRAGWAERLESGR